MPLASGLAEALALPAAWLALVLFGHVGPLLACELETILWPGVAHEDYVLVYWGSAQALVSELGPRLAQSLQAEWARVSVQSF